MKKFAAALLVFALLVSSAVVWAESEVTTDTGIWEKRAYVDEFDLPTDEYYISNKEPIIGKFSNSATTDSPLYVYIYVDDETVRIKLIEYGSHVVKNSYSETKEYPISFMDADGVKYSFNGYMVSGSDHIVVSMLQFIDPNFTQTLQDVIIGSFCQAGISRFVITEEDSPTTEYSFVLEDTAGFENFLPFSEVGYFCGYELAPISRAGKWGYINAEGELKIPCIYDHAGEFSDGLAVVEKDGKYGYINLEGELVIPCKYSNSWEYSDGLALVEQDGKLGFMDKNEDVVIPFQFDRANSFSNGLAAVEVDGKWGYIDTSGEYVIPAIYDNISSFSQNLYVVKQNGKYGIINADGESVVPCELEYDYLGSLSEGFARAYIKTEESGESLLGTHYMWGFVDENGEEIYLCNMDYQHVGDFHDGLAAVQEKDDYYYGYIDYSCNEVIPCQYQHAESFVDGIAKVRMESPENSQIYTYEGLPNAFTVTAYRYGFIDYNGEQVIPCEYLDVVYEEGTFILLDEEGISIVSRDEVQPGWEEELAAYERELAEQAEARKAEAEAQRMLMEYTDKETIQSVQTALNEAGYDCGTPDGIAGRNTQVAISAFQKDNGLNETGTATHELLLALGIIEE